jgi:hypothetical protein
VLATHLAREPVQALIQAHPHRAELAEELARCLDGCEIVYDPEGGGPRSPWRTYRLCLERGIQLGEPFVVVQEDAIVCDRFLEAADQAAAAQPENPLAFFCPAKPPAYTNVMYRARMQGAPWAQLPTGTWVPLVATCWPVELAKQFLHWYDSTRFPPGWNSDDEIAGRFLYHADVSMLVSVPSLVEHPDDVPSVVGDRRIREGRDPGRRAFFWIGDPEWSDYGCDGTVIDWTAEPYR